MNPHRLGVAAAAAILAMAQAACNTGPKFGPPDAISKSGDNQAAPAGTPTAEPVRVVVVDADQRPVPGVQIVFSVTSGGGSVDSSTALTGADGAASPGKWTLGTSIGKNTLVASGNVPGSPLFFTATGVAGPIAALTKVKPDPASAPAGADIDSAVVKAVDQFGNPVSGQPIHFAVTAGGGTASPADVVTGTDGRAATRWTMGAAIDTPNTLTATSGGVSVAFSTVTTRPLGELRIADHVMVVDSSGTITPAVTVVDPTGTVVPGVSYTLLTRSPSVASAGSTTITGLRAGQTILVATATDNPAVSDSAVVIVGKVGSPVVSLNVPRLDLKADTTFTVSLVVDMRSATTKLGAATLQVVWDPAVLTFVSETAGNTAMSVAVNSASGASGSLTVAVASADGAAGVNDLRHVTFKAASTSGTAGSLAVHVADISAAESLANLFAVTVSGSYPLRIR